MTPRVLCLLFPGFEEIETVTPVDLLRRAGAEVHLVSLHGEPWVTGRCQLTLRADEALAGIRPETFSLLLLPGGPGVKAAREDGRPAALAREFAAAGKTVAAICAAPAILHDAGLLEGRPFTCHFSTAGELNAPEAAPRVVVDGSIITSRGAGTALEFGLALVQHLFGPEKAGEISRAIMA